MLRVGDAKFRIREFNVMYVRVANATSTTASHDIDLSRPAKLTIADCHKPPIERNAICHRAWSCNHARSRRRGWRRLGPRNL